MLANCQNTTSKMAKVTSVRIRSVDFSLMTVISVNCDNFEEYFKNYKETHLTDSKKIENLLKQFNTLEPTDSTYCKNIDTRAKIELITSTDTTFICLGNLSLSLDNIQYKTPDSLIYLIESY
jgi:hypothetical protein